MKPVRPGPVVSNLASKAQKALQNKHKNLDPTVLQAARSRAQATLKNIGGSALAETPVGEALQKFIQSRLAKGEGIDELLEALHERAQSELTRRRGLISDLQEILRTYFFGHGKFMRLRSEVLLPAKAGRLSTTQAWQGIDDIVYGQRSSASASSSQRMAPGSCPPGGFCCSSLPATAPPESAAGNKVPGPGEKEKVQATRRTPFRTLLRNFESSHGNVYCSVNGKVEAAAVLGGGFSIGLGGFRHRQGFVTTAYSIGLGCSLEVQGGIELEVSMQKPETARKLTFEVAGGAAYYAGVEVTVCLKPRLGFGHGVHDSWKDKAMDGLIFDYDFDGVKVCLALGTGLDFSQSIAYEDSMLLRP